MKNTRSDVTVTEDVGEVVKGARSREPEVTKNPVTIKKGTYYPPIAVFLVPLFVVAVIVVFLLMATK